MVLQNSWNNILVAGLKVALGSDAVGDTYYRDSSGLLQRLPLGTPGTALIAGSTIPTWGNPTPGGNAGGPVLTGQYPNPTIVANALTFAMMQNVNTAVILGRATTGTGNIESLDPTTARSVLGLGTAAVLNTGTTAGTIPLLQTGGVLDPAVLPAIALTTIQVVTNQAARLALSNVQPGDVAKQTDNGITYVLAATPPSTNSNWVPIGDSIDGGSINTGTIAPARLGGGTPAAGKYLDGGGNWVTLPASGGLAWTEVTGTTGALAANSGYIANNSARVVLTLPTTAAQGTVIKVVGVGTGGWRIAQNASQQIQYLGTVTTSGTSGRVDAEITSSNSFRACVELICTVANTTWVVASSVGILDVA